MRRALLVLVLSVGMTVSAAATLDACECPGIEDPNFWVRCDSICGYYGCEWEWELDRCCIELLGYGSCGDASGSTCDCLCPCGGGGGGF
jgi:hypothetical protein